MVEDALRRLAMTQRKRMVGAILGHAERELYPHLSESQRQAFRVKVLAAVDTYHDLMLDIIGVHDPNELVNAEAIALMRDIREELENLHTREK